MPTSAAGFWSRLTAVLSFFGLKRTPATPPKVVKSTGHETDTLPPVPEVVISKSGGAQAGTRVVKSGEYEITLDISHQILQLKVPELGAGLGEPVLAPSFAHMNLGASKFAPAAALALKAKQFDDGLYAAVEMAADKGLNHFPSRNALILDLLQALATDSNQKAQAILVAAARLRGRQPDVTAALASEAELLEQEFLRDEGRSKVLGFYTWSEELERIFRRDRMLQTKLDEPTARSYAAALAANSELLQAYATNLELAEKLTNPLAAADLREATAPQPGHTPAIPTPVFLFPPSRSAETDLIMKLFPTQPIPEGFNLADEMIRRLRAGTLDLKPRPNSGWYDYQTYALEPLAVPDKAPEGRHLHFDETYRKVLANLFKAGMALTRETHIKQLEVPAVGCAPPPPVRKPQLFVAPDLTVEPLPTYYLRRARSYRFVRGVVQEAFGRSGLAEIRRLTAAGPVDMPLDAELDLMESIFSGAYLRACEEIGMAPEHDPSSGDSQAEDAHRAALTAWLASLDKDPDLGQDIRMMVPVFYDQDRGMTKVWVVLGVSSEPLYVSYFKKPTVIEIKDSDGKRIRQQKVDINFGRNLRSIAQIATAEVYVTQLLNRTEFGQLCDRQKTYDAILKSLK